MSKLAKHYYYDKDGNKKLNCYSVNISKEIVKMVDIKDTDVIEIHVNGKKIIIERSDKNELRS